MLFPALLLAACVSLLWPSQADAQIYAWRDAKGTLVLSDRKLDPGARTYEVLGAPEFRSTRPLPPRTVRGQFEPLVLEHASRNNLRPDLVRAVIQVESGFNPRARSPKGAMGLMQLMPATALQLGVANPYDPSENIRGGTRYLRQLLDRYDGDERLALAAYNAGAGAVDKYGRAVPPYRETRDYVQKVGSVSASGGEEPNPESRTGAPAARRVRGGVAIPNPGGSARGEQPNPESRIPNPGGKRVMYKTIEIVNGNPIPRYTTERPSSGDYEIIN